MKETKVYVDVEPSKIATQLVDLENEQFNCVILMFDTDVKPIEVIVEPKFKDHDRELVKEVCEKIRKEIESQTDVRIAVNNFNTITGHGLEYVFRKIQKEYEDE